jgi:hypothetical protein
MRLMHALPAVFVDVAKCALLKLLVPGGYFTFRRRIDK